MSETAQELGMQVIADQHAQIEILERVIKRVDQERDELAAKYERAVACLKRIEEFEGSKAKWLEKEMVAIIKEHEEGSKADG
jgi:DNA-directed RNA polymerase subunit F